MSKALDIFTLPKRVGLFAAPLPVTGMLDLNHLIPANSGWLLQFANAINDQGQIAGYGTLNGQTEAFLLTPQII